MINRLLEVPRIDDLADVPVTIVPGSNPGVASMTAESDKGAVVTLTWDIIACSVTIRWIENDLEVLTLYRETATKVAVSDQEGWVSFSVWSRTDDVGGFLLMRVGKTVTLTDELLRT